MEELVRDFLKPSEYSIVKATLPLVATLQCNLHGPCFMHFWKLPEKVRVHISAHHAHEQDFQGKHLVGQLDRFEVYRSESGEDDLIVLAFSRIETCEYIECVGQYCRGVFVRQPCPVSQAMVAKIEEISQMPWSWNLIPDSDRKAVLWGIPSALVAIVAWTGVLFFGGPIYDFLHSVPFELAFVLFIIYAVALVVGTVLTALGLIAPIIYSWWQQRSRRRFLTKELRWYRGDVVLG